MSFRLEASLLELSEWLRLSISERMRYQTRRLEERMKAMPGWFDQRTEILKRSGAPIAGIHSTDVTRTRHSRQSAGPKTKNGT
jgi:hypothetical protein